jgi:NAD(P)-dependent dehydrogenase (short-subunit alcohol dehydrogenase family)
MNKPIAFIAGAGDYIGSAVAKKFAREGYLVCLARRNGEKLEPVINEILAEGGEAYGYAMDARDEDAVIDCFASIENTHGPISFVLHNIGGNVNFPIQETTARVFRKVWEMACLSGFLVGREAAKYMVPRSSGSIFFTGATASIRGGSGYAAFAAGKFGLRALAQSMARELGPDNIHVAHLLIDAGVDTAFVRERMIASGQDPDSLPTDTLMNPASIGDTYWFLHGQSKDAWTFELDLRPFAEKF